VPVPQDGQMRRGGLWKPTTGQRIYDCLRPCWGQILRWSQVIGNSVNPLQITRDARRSVAEPAAVRAVETELINRNRRPGHCTVPGNLAAPAT
jgi:hypothetical protein